MKAQIREAAIVKAAKLLRQKYPQLQQGEATKDAARLVKFWHARGGISGMRDLLDCLEQGAQP